MDHWAGVPNVDEARHRARAAAVPGARPAQDDVAAEDASDDVRIRPAGPAQEADRLALMAGHTDDAFVIYGPDGRIDWVNDGFVRMTGYTAAEAVGARRVDLIHGPFTRTEEFARLADDLAARRDAAVEFVTRTKEGSSYWVAVNVRAVQHDGRVAGLVGVERDITQRRHAEERAHRTLRRAESLGIALRHEKHLLGTVLGTIPHLVWWKNTDLRYVGANAAYLAFRGLGSIAEVVGRREDQIDRVDGLGEGMAELEHEVITSRLPINDHTVSIGPVDGRQRTFLVNVLPHFEGTEFAGVIGIGADVSHVADLERQVAQASRLESIGQLAAGIAHEINTPVQYVSDNTRFVADTFGDVLTGLREIADLARDDTGDAAWLRSRLSAVLDRLDLGFVADEVPSALTQSLEGLERVGGIVRAMKDFSHPGQGRADVDLNRVVETTVQVTRSEWKYLAELTLDLDPLAGVVPCFEGELKQVLLNLVVNAAQSIAERRRRTETEAIGRIGVRTERRGDDVLIEVSDDGVGMDESVRTRAFDPFFTTKPVGQGTGQGLSLARDIVVRKHGGHIEIVSAPGQGATFTVSLPCVLPAHLVTPEDAAGSPPSPTGGSPS